MCALYVNARVQCRRLFSRWPPDGRFVNRERTPPRVDDMPYGRRHVRRENRRNGKKERKKSPQNEIDEKPDTTTNDRGGDVAMRLKKIINKKITITINTRRGRHLAPRAGSVYSIAIIIIFYRFHQRFASGHGACVRCVQMPRAFDWLPIIIQRWKKKY